MSQDYHDLRQTLIRARAQQDYKQMQRSALLMRGRLFTWLNAYRSRLKELGRNKPLNIAAYHALEHEVIFKSERSSKNVSSAPNDLRIRSEITSRSSNPLAN